MEDRDLDIVIDSFELSNYDDDLICSNSYVYVNGERIDSDGNHIKAILGYLGYNVTVEYN